MNDDLNAASKRISRSILAGAILIASSIMFSSPGGRELYLEIILPFGGGIGLIYLVGILVVRAMKEGRQYTQP